MFSPLDNVKSYKRKLLKIYFDNYAYILATLHFRKSIDNYSPKQSNLFAISQV